MARLSGKAARALEQHVHRCLHLEPKDTVSAYGRKGRLFELSYWCPDGPQDRGVRGCGGSWMQMDGLFERSVSHVLYCAQMFLDFYPLRNSRDESEKSDWSAVVERLARSVGYRGKVTWNP